MHTDGTLHLKGSDRKGMDTDRNSVLTTDTHTDTHTDRQSTSASVELRFAAKKKLKLLREPTAVLSDGEADVLRCDSVILQHSGDDPSLLQHLGSEVLQDGRQVDRGKLAHP